MDVVTISLFIILELAMLLGVAVFLVARKNRQLQAKLESLTSEKASCADEDFESIASGYLPYLEKQVLETREHAEFCQEQSQPDDQLLGALNYRLSLLEAEKKVAERCNDYPEKRWQHVSDLFVPPEEPEADEADAPTVEPVDNTAVNDELVKAKKRIKNLEKFRDNFFSMKKQLKSLEDGKQALVEKLEALLPEIESSEELMALLDSLNTQHDRLRDEMAQLEAQADELANGDDAEPQEESEPPQRITELNNVLGEQGNVIGTIRRVVEQVKEDPSSELISELEKQLKELEKRYQEASDCLEIMTEESERLQDKVDRKEQRIERIEEEKNESVANLAEQVDKQKRKMSELHGMVGDLQLEAEKAEELKAKLQQFDLASRDMNMCIQVLEEENELLHAQVAALQHVEEELEKMQQVTPQPAEEAFTPEGRQALEAQLADRDREIAALKQAQSGAGDEEDLQRQIGVLKDELAETEKRRQDAEARYTEMEQEYLTLYEEANS